MSARTEQDIERAAERRLLGPAEQELDPVLAFMQRLWSIDRSMRAISGEMRSRLGVTGPERLILRMVGQCPTISAGQLARLLRRHPSTLTGALDRLIRRRMLKGEVDAADRRRLILTLTPAGRQINRVNSGTVEAFMRRALSGISSQDLKTASEVLAAVECELMSRSEDSDD